MAVCPSADRNVEFPGHFGGLGPGRDGGLGLLSMLFEYVYIVVYVIQV